MLNYLLKRILLFIPTLIIISLLSFIISVNAPGDPVSRMMTTAGQGDILNEETAVQKEQKIYWTHKLGLDLPVFYFSLVPISFPDTLYKIYDKSERSAARSLVLQSGNWTVVQQFHSSIKNLFPATVKYEIDSVSSAGFSENEINAARNEATILAGSLLHMADLKIISLKLHQLDSLYLEYPSFLKFQNQLATTQAYFGLLKSRTNAWKTYIPSVRFYANNQYHRWIFGDGNWITGKGSIYSKGLIRGDFGISYYSLLPVSTVIMNKIGWSLFFTLISVLLAYLISIPIGIRAAMRSGSAFDKTSSIVLLTLQSMPPFWVATMLLVVFANPDVYHWFPASGVKPVVGYPSSASFFEKIRLSFPYIILPLIAYTYSSLAFLSRLTRTSVLEVVQQEYIKTARAKGLRENTVIYRHVFRNSLLPLITVFSNVLPAAMGGSVILESIFTIPGMGYASYFAIQSQDYPMIIGVFTITGFLTLIGYLISDILYSVADPRISFSKKRHS